MIQRDIPSSDLIMGIADLRAFQKVRYFPLSVIIVFTESSQTFGCYDVHIEWFNPFESMLLSIISIITHFFP